MNLRTNKAIITAMCGVALIESNREFADSLGKQETIDRLDTANGV